MSSEQESQPEADGPLTKPGSSSDTIIAEDEKLLKIDDKEIGQGDTQLTTSGIAEDDKTCDDVELILDDDDDEDMHLKWDDDEEIEDDIISLDIPASPARDVKQGESSIQTDENALEDKNMADDIEKLIKSKPANSERSIKLNIADICAKLDEEIKKIDDFNENEAKEANSAKSKSSITDLILIEDDDNTDQNVENIENDMDDVNIKDKPSEQINDDVGDVEKIATKEIDEISDENFFVKSDSAKDDILKDCIKKDESELQKNRVQLDLSTDESETANCMQIDLAKEEFKEAIENTPIDLAKDEFKKAKENTQIDLVKDDSKQNDNKSVKTRVANDEIAAESISTEIKEESDNSVDVLNKKDTADKDLVANSPNESLLDASVYGEKNDHRLNKPDVMLEIPTQEVIEFLDDSDVSTGLNKSNESSEVLNENLDSKKDSTLAMNENNVEVTVDTKLTPDLKKVEEEENRDTKDVIHEPKEKYEAMDVTENVQEELEGKSKPETITPNILETTTLEGHTTDTNQLEITKNLAAEAETVPEESTDHNLKTITEEKQTKDTDTTSLTEDKVKKTSKNEIDEQKPSTSKEMEAVSAEARPLTSDDLETVKPCHEMEVTDELQEVTDSLGLLAESSRVMEDDEEQEDDEDDDDDFDQEDESSNQVSAEHSEDSNAQQSETDGPKDQDDKGTDSPQEEKEFNFAINNVESAPDKAEVEDKGDLPEKEADIPDKDGDVEVDEIEDDVEVTPEQIGDVSTVEDTEIAVEVSSIAVTEEAPQENKPSEPKQVDDVETVKLSDTSDNEGDSSVLRQILVKPAQAKVKAKSLANKLEISTTSSNLLHYVDLEESSSEDDVLEVDKKDSAPPPETAKEVENVATVAAGLSKTPAKPRTPRINTSEISIRTISSAEAAALPQIQPPEEKPAPKLGLEVFSLDSDEEEVSKPVEIPQEPEKPRKKHKCINLHCKSAGRCEFTKADAATLAYYDAARNKRTMVCEKCANAVVKRTQSLIDGIKNFTPLLHLDIAKVSQELVEISDSESEEEDVAEEVKEKEMIGEKGVKLLEEHLADMINETWKKFKLDARLAESESMLNDEIKMLEEQSKEIDSMLNDCQLATDKLRKELYATFEHDRQELTPLIIHDTPTIKSSYLDIDSVAETTSTAKRRMSTGNESPAKRLHTDPIPLGYAPIDSKEGIKDNINIQDKSTAPDPSKVDDDKDISVLQVSAEVAPPSLPPPGPLSRPPLRVGAAVYAMRNVLGSWLKGRILEVQGKTQVPGSTQMFTVCKVKFEAKARNPVKLLPARCLAYSEPTDVRMTIGTRVIALFTNDSKRETFYSGIISEVPNPVNKYRYLVFFDDGYAQYVRHEDTRLVCECAPLVWEEVHPFSREFVREYLMAYPERPMVRLHAGQSLKTEWNGKWWSSRVIKVDASLVQVHFEEDNRTEWIYRGSTRLAPLYLELQAAERHRARPMPRTKAQPRVNMPYVEYTRSDEQNKTPEPAPTNERETRQRAVAKKSTTPAPAPAPAPAVQPTDVTSRVVYYTPKNAVKPLKMTPHNCGPHCRRTDVLALKDLRTYNPLAKPLLSGWERQIVRFKGHKEVMYRAPCGRRLRNMRELHRYLRAIQSDMAVDLFDFAPGTHCLAEFVLNSCLVGKKDLSHGKENVPVPCVNYYDESLPEFCSYNTERTPTTGVPLNLDPAFLCGCDCLDDCEDKNKCACWRMTLEGARTIGYDAASVGYVYRRLPEPLPTGIYECNSRCKCKQTCLNRVAQHPLQLKLQVFKTLNRGWGIRALNDVPKGSFLCVYAGNLLTDATANMDGLNEGDEYLAELDYIEVVEQMKEGYEEDIPEADKKLDKKNQAKESEEDSEEMTSSEEEDQTGDDKKDDDDFRPAAGELIRITEFSKRLRKREKKKQKEDAKQIEKEKEATQNTEDDCITISDDEEVREPSRFMAQAGMESNEFKRKYKSVRAHFGKDEACYIMDAKVQGNIGRYLNHSCTPNVFVQNVFVDTHDPRFPWVAFFALCHIKAGTELTWNYNYDVGSVPGKILYCYCGAPNCRGRLL